MAKDGTVRGGQRTGFSRKPKVLTDKFAAGNLGGRKLTVFDFSDTADLSGVEEFRKAQAEIEKKNEKPMSQKMFKAI